MPEPPVTTRRVAVMGIDNFSRKNIAQVAGLNARGFTFDIFTNDRIGDSAANLPAGNGLYILAEGFVARTYQLVRYLIKHASTLNHVEVYPGGRYAGVIVLLCKIFNVPLITVERGDIKRYDRHGRITRLSMKVCYRNADVVWYREHYAERKLQEIGVKELFFLPNAIELPSPNSRASSPTIDFLWVNRLVPERRADWFVELMALPEFSHAKGVLAGLKDNQAALISTQQEYVLQHCPENVELIGWTDPTDLYRAARFFVLPSELVFCNNSLLEAMARGVVPIVSDVQGADLIVKPGHNGFRFHHSKEGFRDALSEALSLLPEEYDALSRNTIDSVRESFGMDNYLATLSGLYNQVSRHAHGSFHTSASVK